MTFTLKTSAALALGAYLVVEKARNVLAPRQPQGPTTSALAPIPEELAVHVMPHLASAR